VITDKQNPIQNVFTMSVVGVSSKNAHGGVLCSGTGSRRESVAMPAAWKTKVCLQ